MGKYIVQRLVAAAITLFIIISLSFFILRLMPGSFVSDPLMKPEVRKAIESKYHLDKPLSVQYGYFLKDFVRLDFGVSTVIRPEVPVNQVIMSKIPETIRINAYSMLFSLPIGIALGIWAAIKKNTVHDHIVSTSIMVCISVPFFVFATLLQYLVGYKLGWLPILVSTDRGITWDKFVSLIMPTLSVSFGTIAGLARSMRAELSEALNTDYMLLAKSKGLSHFQATIRHAIRNSIIPLMGMFIGMFLGLLGGSMVLERLFSIPGIGSASIEAINAKDHPMTIGLMFWFTMIGLIGVLIIDMSYGLVDPRIRMGGRK